MISVMLWASRPIDLVVTTPAIGASTVAVASPVIFPIWLYLTASTRVVSSNGPSVLSPKMACPTKPSVGTCGATTASSSPTPPSRTGSRRLGEKVGQPPRPPTSTRRLADFSGYLAGDEVYDGPFCILSVVDNRRYNRLAFRVLEDDPTQDDVLAFLAEFKGQLDKRNLSVRGIYYGRIVALPQGGGQGVVAQGLHAWKSVSSMSSRRSPRAVLHALAKLPQGDDPRRLLQATAWPATQRAAGPSLLADWLAEAAQVADLFEHRYLFVRHHLKRYRAEAVAETDVRATRTANAAARSWKRCTGCLTAVARPRRP